MGLTEDRRKTDRNPWIPSVSVDQAPRGTDRNKRGPWGRRPDKWATGSSPWASLRPSPGNCTDCLLPEHQPRTPLKKKTVFNESPPQENFTKQHLLRLCKILIIHFVSTLWPLRIFSSRPRPYVLVLLSVLPQHLSSTIFQFFSFIRHLSATKTHSPVYLPSYF